MCILFLTNDKGPPIKNSIKGKEKKKKKKKIIPMTKLHCWRSVLSINFRPATFKFWPDRSHSLEWATGQNKSWRQHFSLSLISIWMLLAQLNFFYHLWSGNHESFPWTVCCMLRNMLAYWPDREYITDNYCGILLAQLIFFITPNIKNGFEISNRGQSQKEKHSDSNRFHSSQV